ncbi:hypothetical protein TRIUR3_18565 [Triticum urartu]|uniref:Uncharacterized protein n=1 Tax=Triticum urartu TaxID=4572 RepID=M7ZQ12_TRIUA|nr:hypothetical protein TRIUR3_18565 [Triticum urartu]
MEAIAEELGVSVEVLLRGLPPRLRHAADGVILRQFARLGCRADYLRVRDPETPDLMRLLHTFTRVRGHVPYMPLWDASNIYHALLEEGGPATSHHRQVIITNPDVLLAKYRSYRAIVEQMDLLDSVSQSVEEVLTLRLQAQFEACVADLRSTKANLQQHAWRLVLLYLRQGDILEARHYLQICFPGVSQRIDNNPARAFEAYQLLLTTLQDEFVVFRSRYRKEEGLPPGLTQSANTDRRRTSKLSYLMEVQVQFILPYLRMNSDSLPQLQLPPVTVVF